MNLFQINFKLNFYIKFLPIVIRYIIMIDFLDSIESVTHLPDLFYFAQVWPCKFIYIYKYTRELCFFRRLNFIFQIVAITSEGKCKSKASKVKTLKDESK